MNQVDFTKQYMFFGESPNIVRYDIQKYPKIDQFTEQQLGFYWRETEVDITKDKADFNSLQPNEKHLFIANLKYQSLLDSHQGRSPVLAFLPICSLPELETWLETWAFSETIHSRSYTHILRNIVNEPAEVFDNILNVPEIMARAKPIVQSCDKLINSFRDGSSVREQKEHLFKAMVNTNALEGIRFYVSFACTFALAEQEKMEGNAKIVSLIARDEFLHLGGTHFILTRWLGGLDDPEMTEVALDNIDYIRDTIKAVVDQEKAWAKYLFKDGSIIGLNEKILSEYLEYLADTRLEELLSPTINGVKQDFGFEPLYGKPSNPLPWMDDYLQSKSVQVAPQETEITSYLTGSVDTNIGDDFLGELDL